MRTMNVCAIVTQSDRKVLYGTPDPDTSDPFEFHVIAGLDDDVEVGDFILHDNMGINFAFFEKVINTKNRL